MGLIKGKAYQVRRQLLFDLMSEDVPPLRDVRQVVLGHEVASDFAGLLVVVVPAGGRIGQWIGRTLCKSKKVYSHPRLHSAQEMNDLHSLAELSEGRQVRVGGRRVHVVDER